MIRRRDKRKPAEGDTGGATKKLDKMAGKASLIDAKARKKAAAAKARKWLFFILLLLFGGGFMLMKSGSLGGIMEFLKGLKGGQ